MNREVAAYSRTAYIHVEANLGRSYRYITDLWCIIEVAGS